MALVLSQSKSVQTNLNQTLVKGERRFARFVAGPVLPLKDVVVEHKNELKAAVVKTSFDPGILDEFRSAGLPINPEILEKTIDCARETLNRHKEKTYFWYQSRQDFSVQPGLHIGLEIFRKEDGLQRVYFYSPQTVFEKGSWKKVAKAVQIIFKDNQILSCTSVARAGIRDDVDVERAVQKFNLESQILATVTEIARKDKRGELVCQLLDASPFTAGVKAEQLSMYMPLYGPDLFSIIHHIPGLADAAIPLLPRVFLSLTEQVAFLHDNGIILRDIKDENIVSNASKDLSMIDFGGGNFTHETLPPETWDGSPFEASKSADVWALGCVFLGLLNKEETPWYPLLRFVKKLQQAINPEAGERKDREKPNLDHLKQECTSLCTELQSKDLSFLGTLSLPPKDPHLDEIYQRLQRFIENAQGKVELKEGIERLISLLRMQLPNISQSLAQDDPKGNNDIEILLRNLAGFFLTPDPNDRYTAKEFLEKCGDHLRAIALKQEDNMLPAVVRNFLRSRITKTFVLDVDSIERIHLVAQKALKGMKVLKKREIEFVELPAQEGLPPLHIFRDKSSIRTYLRVAQIAEKGTSKLFRQDFCIEYPSFGYPKGFWVAGLDAKDPRFILSHRDEVAVLEDMGTSPQSGFFPKVYDYIDDEKTFSYQKQELGKLYLDRNKPLEQAQHEKLVLRLAWALMHQLMGMQKKGIVHADICHSNIIANVEEDVLLTNFGSVNSNRTTRYVVSPERCSEYFKTGKMPVAKHEDDIWAAGILLIDALNNTPDMQPRWVHLLILLDEIDALLRNKETVGEAAECKAGVVSWDLLQAGDFIMKLLKTESLEIASLDPHSKIDEEFNANINRCKELLKGVKLDTKGRQFLQNQRDFLKQKIEDVFANLRKRLDHQILNLRELNPILKGVRTMAMKMLDPNPIKRPNAQTLKQYADYLMQLSSGESV